MNKAELVSAVAKKSGLKKAQTEQVIEALSEVIREELKHEDGRVVIPAVGSFKTVKRNARLVRNPKTGEKMEAPECLVVKFVVSQGFKDSINQ